MNEENLPPVQTARSVALVADLRTVDQKAGSFRALSAVPTSGLKAELQIREIRSAASGDELTASLQFRLEGIATSEREGAENTGADSGSNRVLCIEVDAEFSLTYLVPELKSQPSESVEAFTHVNALYNAWPYWREYVQSATGRAGYPPMVLPVLRVVDGEVQISTGDDD